MTWIEAARDAAQNGWRLVDQTTGGIIGEVPREVLYSCEQCDSSRSTTCHHCGQRPYRGPGIVLDTFTASMLVAVHDALSETNRARFAGFPLTMAVDVGWKLMAQQRQPA